MIELKVWGHRAVLITLVTMTLCGFAWMAGVFGASWTDSCLNDTAMIQEVNINISGTVVPMNNIVECLYNCSNVTQRCNDNPMETSPWGFVPIAIMFPLFAFVFVYIALNVGKKHAILGWFFIPMSLIMMLIGVFSMINYENSLNIKTRKSVV